jgi:hypothetical protein
MRRLFIAAALALTVAAPAAAADLSVLRRAELSARLYEAGIEGADPLLIIAAAKLRKSFAPQPGGPRPVTPGPGAAEPPMGWDEMLTAALNLAPGDDLIAALVDDVRVETSKGVVTGPIYGLSSLAPGRADVFEGLDFRGGEYAEVYVEARGRSDMKLYVEDAQGRLVCSDTDASHIAYCGWRPAATARFTVRVENRGPVATGYALMTN